VTGMRPAVAVGAAAGVAVAVVAGMAALAEAAGDSAAKAPVGVMDNMMAAVAIVLRNLMRAVLSQVVRPVMIATLLYRLKRCEI
jgi:hypothetical protein